MYRLGLFVMLLSMVGGEGATEWIPIGATGGVKVFIDVSSIKIAGPIRRVWIKQLYPPHSQRLEEKWVDYIVNRDAINCVNESWRTEASAVYYDDSSNHLLESESLPRAWQPVLPDSTGRVELMFTCAWHSK